MNDWNVYLLVSENLKRTYIGATNNPERRLKCHNGLLSGGAKATKRGRPWNIICVISGFDKISALQFEWRLKKRRSKRTNKLVSFSGLKNKIKNVYDVLRLEKWTSKSRHANEVPLILNWYESKYKLLNEILPDYIKELIIN